MALRPGQTNVPLDGDEIHMLRHWLSLTESAYASDEGLLREAQLLDAKLDAAELRCEESLRV